MEAYKSVILSVVMLSLVFAQLQAEAELTVCCPSTSARSIYELCRYPGQTRRNCADLSGCIIQSSSTCKPPNDHEIVEGSGDHSIHAYCKLGCASSVCNGITALRTSSGEVANEAVEQCVNACAAFCTKDSTAVA